MNQRADNIIPFPGQEPHGALVLRVELVLMPHPVWRRLRIDDRATFWDLHVAIQDAMGWSHRHRHMFIADDPFTGERLRLGIPEPDTFHGRQAVVPSWQLQVSDVVRPQHPPFLYTYHLGEEWQHEISLEALEAPQDRGPVPACLDGAGVCPPEGCGGPVAYSDSLRAGAEKPNQDFDPDDITFCDAGLLWKDLFAAD